MKKEKEEQIRLTMPLKGWPRTAAPPDAKLAPLVKSWATGFRYASNIGNLANRAICVYKCGSVNYIKTNLRYKLFIYVLCHIIHLI